VASERRGDAVAPGVDVEAAAAMGHLHDALADAGCPAALRGRTLVRVATCLFAQDTGLFAADAFTRWLRAQSQDGAGSDLGEALRLFFARIGSPDVEGAGDGLAHVPGGLFDRAEPAVPTTDSVHDALLAACEVSWAHISPALFGSLLQRVMDAEARRGDGVHYTPEAPILAAIEPLVLDELEVALTEARDSKRSLRALHGRIARLQLLDPSCGCGNFLVVAYRRLRQLEHGILAKLIPPGQQVLDLEHQLRVTPAQCHGIELQPFAADVARLSLWLVDHQMNLEAATTFGRYFARPPLSTAPNIVCGNALTLPWSEVVTATDDTVVLGNPPYGGKKEQSAEQKADVTRIWQGTPGAGKLDLVASWFRLAADYTRGTAARCGFVATNSITQGEQAGVLWRHLRQRQGVHIHFAHRAFPWRDGGPGSASVHVVIIGMSHRVPSQHRLYAEGAVHAVDAINAYLVDAPDAYVDSRSAPLCDVPPMAYGSMMIDRPRGSDDDAGLLVTPAARDTLLRECAALEPHIRSILGGEEFLRGDRRYCLWLVDAPPALALSSPSLARRLDAVRAFRSQSRRAQTRKLSASPSLFGEIRQPGTPYLLVPKVSSETRPRIPIGFVEPEVIASGSALTVAGATAYHFGVLSSAMHDAWVRTVAGRMKSDLQYSSSIVYNNFPWPAHPDARARATVESAARAVLETRQRAGAVPLGELYRSSAMPEDLRNAHGRLDEAVDHCYGDAGFTDVAARLRLLFARHAELVGAL